MNSKKLAILAIFGLLILGIAIFGIYTKKMNAEGVRGIGVSVSGVEQETVDEWMGSLENALKRDDVLEKIVSESNYSANLLIPEGEAVSHLRNAVKVSHSKTRNSIVIGLRGKRKYTTELDTIAQHILNVAGTVVAQEKPAFARHYKAVSQAGQ